MLDAKSAPSARAILGGLRSMCSAAPAQLLWPSNHLPQRDVWPIYVTDRDVLLRSLDLMLATLPALERGELVWIYNA